MPKLISDASVYLAALKTLAERGYAGATTRLIADAAGINEATLFRKYGSKPELITQAIQHGAFALDEGSMAYTGSIEDDLVRAAQCYTAMMQRDGSLFPIIMSEMARHPELRATVSGPHEVIRELAALLLQYQEEGVLHTEEGPLQAVASFLGPLIVIAMLQGASPQIAPQSLHLRGHVGRFLRGRLSAGSARK